MPAAQPATVLDLINLFAKFGANIPLVLAFIQTIVDGWQKLQEGIAAAGGGAAKKLTAISLSADESAACHKLYDTHVKAIPGRVAAFDGHRIANLMALLKSSKELFALVSQFLPLIEAAFGVAA